jgi:5'-nucleotidase (lipoprotein e(P4) family)
MKLFILLVMSTLLISCATKKRDLVDQSILGVNWFQTAGEVRALQYQAYQAAKVQLWRALKINTDKPKAIVVDVDETVLDNSPYQAQNVIDGTGYPTGWKEWVMEAKAKPIPGAVEFLNYAAKKGVVTFYVSNRRTWGVDATYKNLKEYNFPVEKKNMLFKTTTSNKEPRRLEILKNYEIIMLVGDNLGDFHVDFEHKLYKERNATVDEMKKHFGKRYIVLPNPMYGSWEGAMSKGYFGLDVENKNKVRHQVLEYWK